MDNYKLMKGPKGNRFFKNGRLTKTVNVPEDIRTKLESGQVLEQTDAKRCIFCSAYGVETRFVNMQTIALCEEHFYAKNIGQIAQRLREVYSNG